MENLENNVAEAVTEPTEEAKETVTMTRDELEELIQKTSDKRVTSALQTYQRNQEKKQREADKLKSMSAEEKYQYQLEEREKAVLQKEHELSLAENKAVLAQILAEKGLSPKFVEFCVNEDADVMMDNVRVIEKAFKSSVRQEVEKRLASKTPAKSYDAKMTKEMFNKLSYAQRVELKNNEPELYEQLMN